MFPYSNDGFSQVFGDETAECVCQVLLDIFEFIGGVPPLLIFDNATGVGRRVGDSIHESERFARFRTHYHFRVRFCNPYARWKKGNVERKVDYNRANLFVPVPYFKDVEKFNRKLLLKHEKKASELHYKKQITIRELFEEDRKALLVLSPKPFYVCRYWEADGIPNGAGHLKWHESHIHQILTNEKYIGDALLQKTYTVSILDKKRATNNGEMPKYYVEGSHEDIIDRDVFMKVKAEIARRANLNPDGKCRVYNSKYALSGKAVKEEALQGAIVTAVNDAYARKNAVIYLLKTNIQETDFDDFEARIAAIDEQLAELQQQMLDNSGDNALMEELGLQMDDLRGDRQDILAEAAERTDLQARMNDMIAFLEEMPQLLRSTAKPSPEGWSKESPFSMRRL